MKHILVLILLFGISIQTNSQTTYIGQIKDHLLDPINGVSIQSSTNPSNGVATNIHGEFTIVLEQPEVLITSIGYQPMAVTLQSSDNIIILEQSQDELEEVIVSASREAQKRAEIPGAISVITAARL